MHPVQHTDSLRKSIHQLFDEFLFEAEFVKKVRPKTLLAYRHTFNLFQKLVPDISLNEITSATVVQFFKILQERKRPVGRGMVKIGIKKSTVATYWSKLNAFFQWLVTKKYISRNPFAELPYPSPTYEDKKYLKKKEIEKILAAIYMHHNNNPLILRRNLALFYLLLFCGLRKGELLQLQIRDLDIEKRILTIRAEASKTQKSRDIPLQSNTLMVIKEYLQARRGYTTPFLIVSSKCDVALTPEGLNHIVDALANRSGIQFHLHQLRHTFAVNFLLTTNNIVKLKQLLGHQSIMTTMIYLRCLPVSEMREDIENMQFEKFI